MQHMLQAEHKASHTFSGLSELLRILQGYPAFLVTKRNVIDCRQPLLDAMGAQYVSFSRFLA